MNTMTYDAYYDIFYDDFMRNIYRNGLDLNPEKRIRYKLTKVVERGILNSESS